MASTVRLERLTPAAATLVIDSQVHGRVTGPNCRYASTIEVSYPVNDTGRVVIPDPAWWDPESPFLYSVQLPQQSLTLGLRHCTINGDDVIWNGMPLQVNTVRPAEVSEQYFEHVRNREFNAVIVQAEDVLAACMIADRIGLLVIGEWGRIEVDVLVHPSFLRWASFAKPRSLLP